MVILLCASKNECLIIEQVLGVRSVFFWGQRSELTGILYHHTGEIYMTSLIAFFLSPWRLHLC